MTVVVGDGAISDWWLLTVTAALYERLYIPVVEASATPVVGMQFNSIEQAYVFYQTYAKLAGFSSRKGGETHSGGIIKTKYFVCSKEGHKPLVIDDAYSKYSYATSLQAIVRSPKEMIWELGTLNLGPVKAFHIMRKRYGGFEKVGAMVDAQINSYIGEYDADMVINRLTDKKEYLVDFSFEYSVGEDKRLTGLFWADGLCKRNFMEFRDVISFDATFKTNKYKMVFVPFTGIDNHCGNVTLGARLLASESIESYKWLLNSFVNSFGRQPKFVVTYQDPAMKQAIEGSIEPEIFEREWKLVMIEFGLTENKWIDDMFVMRSMWIQAFYRHEPMSGLMRTTSRSEKLLNHFDGSMDVQRFNHRKNDHISRYTEPDDWSKTTLEADAAKVYTRSIFFDKQTEIYGTISECLPMDTKIDGDQLRISFKDFKAHGEGFLEVCFKKLENGENRTKTSETGVPGAIHAGPRVNLGKTLVKNPFRIPSYTNSIMDFHRRFRDIFEGSI
ncbi:protein FAR1-RELATED SEQUENCE 5-like [Helianthus annuus]|uniref:protein FAR1-RELATED SEQUENCE 5-like n=1 Tax=Helianthus annuus TaxID=4232 RepID=UPI000B907E74|nr:protein FAR1-RELATED SEQUENCE 5-like [Helianthus annuus]